MCNAGCHPYRDKVKLVLFETKRLSRLQVKIIMFLTNWTRMLCTAAEIERKKRLAKVKLLQKRTQHSRNLNDGPGITSNLAQTNTSPASPKFFPKAKSVPGTSSSFDKSPKPRNNSFPSSNNKFNTKPFNNDQRIQATCILLTSNRFQVKLSAYFNVAIEVMKTIPSKSYGKIYFWFCKEHW